MRLTIAFSVAGGVAGDASDSGDGVEDVSVAGGPGAGPVRGCGVVAAKSGGTTGGTASGAVLTEGSASPGNRDGEDSAMAMVPEGLDSSFWPSKGRSPAWVRVRSATTSGESAWETRPDASKVSVREMSRRTIFVQVVDVRGKRIVIVSRHEFRSLKATHDEPQPEAIFAPSSRPHVAPISGFAVRLVQLNARQASSWSTLEGRKSSSLPRSLSR